MKQKSLSISIPEPCHENWSEMTPVEKGRHCQSCQKTVVDFTRMPKVQIAEYITAQNGNLCGRFSSDQLNVELIPPKPSKSWLKYAAIILGLVPNIGCGQEVTVPEKPALEISPPPATGIIAVSKKGWITKNSHEASQVLNITGKVVDASTNEPLNASIIIHLSSREKKQIKIDQNGRFRAKIPKNSILTVRCKGYENQIFQYADLEPKYRLLISLHKKENFVKGIMVEHKPEPKTDPKQEEVIRIKQSSKKIPGRKKLEPVEQLNKGQWNKDRKQTQGGAKVDWVEGCLRDAIKDHNDNVDVNNTSQNQAVDMKLGLQNDSQVITDHEITESNLPVQYLLPTVELVGKKPERTQICVTGLYAIVKEEESWYKRLWRKFKSLLSESHKEAEKNQKVKSDQLASISTIGAANEKIEQGNIAPSKKAAHENQKIGQATDVEINIYPNPSNGFFNIDIPDNVEKFFIEVTDVNNQLILRINHDQFEGMIDLSTKKAGSYIISIISEGQLITSKMMIKI